MQVRFDNPQSYLASLVEVAEATFPELDVQPLDPGSWNAVVKAGEFILKSPLISDPAEKEAMIRHEADTVAQLPEVVELDTGTELKLPQLVVSRYCKSLPHNIFSFVGGDVLDATAICLYEEADKIRLGKDIGLLAAWLSDGLQIDISHIAAVTEETTAISVLKKYRLPYVNNIRRKGFPQIASLVEEFVGKPDPPDILESVPAHGDLRPSNLTFKNNQLTGVFDFGNARFRDPADELRWAYIIDEAVAKAAISQYSRETQAKLSLESIAHYAGVQVVAGASSSAIHHRSLPPTHRNFLLNQYPDRDWSELDRLPTS